MLLFAKEKINKFFRVRKIFYVVLYKKMNNLVYYKNILSYIKKNYIIEKDIIKYYSFYLTIIEDKLKTYTA